ncbi:Rrf2 family transcriptional regulator [Thermodesulfobium sp. 4217-1]|uniref:RrF2 family transcriptional regulator n=1 Tax=Thermodesulfobium sp. 4217-1 TaxID=3120013 RepID=UPI003222206A
MFKLSTKTRYGLRALCQLAQAKKGYTVPAHLLAKDQEISLSYLEQVLNVLKHHDIVESFKGPGGGYKLNKDPKKIILKDIIEILEGPVLITECSADPGKCHRAEDCLTRALWQKIGNQVNSFLEKLTLNDLVKKNCKKLCK